MYFAHGFRGFSASGREDMAVHVTSWWTAEQRQGKIDSSKTWTPNYLLPPTRPHLPHFPPPPNSLFRF
jgi:hypothetical protein